MGERPSRGRVSEIFKNIPRAKNMLQKMFVRGNNPKTNIHDRFWARDVIEEVLCTDKAVSVGQEKP